jgi:hypothetical protein
MAPKLELAAQAEGDTALRDRFLAEFEGSAAGADYLDAVRRLSPDIRKIGTAWLQSIVDSVPAVTKNEGE